MSQLYHQCHLTRGEHHQTAWLPTTAIQGSIVELMPARERWRVKKAYTAHTLTKEQLTELQLLNRHSLPSVEAIA